MSEKNENKLVDVIKKVVSTGVSAAFMTEDAIKNIVNEIPLPKDFLNGVLDNARATKNEIISTVKTELKGYMSKLDISKEIDRVIDKYDFEVKATINLKKKDKKNGD